MNGIFRRGKLKTDKNFSKEMPSYKKTRTSAENDISCCFKGSKFLNIHDKSMGSDVLAFGFFNFILAIITSFLSSWFLFIFFKNRTLNTEQKLQLLPSLALSDFLCSLLGQFLFGLQMILVSFNKAQHYYILSEIHIPATYVFTLVRVVCVVNFCTERYLATFHVYFFEVHSTRLNYFLVQLAIWIIAVAFFILTLIIHSNETYRTIGTVVVATACLWQLFAYTRIFLTIRKVRRQIQTENIRLHGMKFNKTFYNRTYKSLGYIFAFFVSYLPMVVWLNVEANCKANHDHGIMVVKTVTFFTCSVNSAFHLLYNSNVRAELLNLFRKRDQLSRDQARRYASQHRIRVSQSTSKASHQPSEQIVSQPGIFTKTQTTAIKTKSKRNVLSPVCESYSPIHLESDQVPPLDPEQSAWTIPFSPIVKRASDAKKKGADDNWKEDADDAEDVN